MKEEPKGPKFLPLFEEYPKPFSIPSLPPNIAGLNLCSPWLRAQSGSGRKEDRDRERWEGWAGLAAEVCGESVGMRRRWRVIALPKVGRAGLGLTGHLNGAGSMSSPAKRVLRAPATQERRGGWLGQPLHHPGRDGGLGAGGGEEESAEADEDEQGAGEQRRQRQRGGEEKEEVEEEAAFPGGPEPGEEGGEAERPQGQLGLEQLRHEAAAFAAAFDCLRDLESRLRSEGG